MDPATAALLAAGVAGGASWFGQSSANRASAKESQKQMDFQERMSSTAYQRAKADMEAAGINPLIAFSSGASGASTPAGSSARQESTTAAGVSSALQAARLRADLENIKSQTELNQAAAQVSKINAESGALDLPAKRIESAISEWTSSKGFGLIKRFFSGLFKGMMPR